MRLFLPQLHLGIHMIDIRNQSLGCQVTISRIAKEIATNQIEKWRGYKCGQEINSIKTVTFTSRLLRELP